MITEIIKNGAVGERTSCGRQLQGMVTLNPSIRFSPSLEVFPCATDIYSRGYSEIFLQRSGS